MNDNAAAKNPPHRMPRGEYRVHISPRVIAAPLLDLKRWQADEAAVRREYPWAERFVMGPPLPTWQRPVVWAEEQSRRFIVSAWTGIHLGNYVLTGEHLRPGRHIEYEPLAICVLEGQQRLRALELYFTSQLAVPDVDGVRVLWHDVDHRDQLRLEHTTFGPGVVDERDERKLREFYDLLNFGGVAHTENERATPGTTGLA